jgi:hypothetical protein
MNAFTSTTLNYSLVQDRRHSFEQAAARRRMVRTAGRAQHSAPPSLGRPPDPGHVAPVLALLDKHSDLQHLPAASVGEPATTRVA